MVANTRVGLSSGPTRLSPRHPPLASSLPNKWEAMENRQKAGRRERAPVPALAAPAVSLPHMTDAYGFRQWNGSSPSILSWGHYPSILQRRIRGLIFCCLHMRSFQLKRTGNTSLHFFSKQSLIASHPKSKEANTTIKKKKPDTHTHKTTLQQRWAGCGRKDICTYRDFIRKNTSVTFCSKSLSSGTNWNNLTQWDHPSLLLGVAQVFCQSDLMPGRLFHMLEGNWLGDRHRPPPPSLDRHSPPNHWVTRIRWGGC